MTARRDFLTIRFSADPVQVAIFRYGFDRWLQGLRWPEADRIDAILAVSEACTNAARHAYPIGFPGDVEVVGRLILRPTDRQIVVVVRDWGRWQPEATDEGYGLTTIRACMARVKIRGDGGGTTVTMTSNPVPLAVTPESVSS